MAAPTSFSDGQRQQLGDVPEYVVPRSIPTIILALVPADVPFFERPDDFLDAAEFDEAAFVLLKVLPTVSIRQC